ncbi:MAG: phosphoribosylformimino-5-aminoimidazole carboxamide ribotide isomerase [Roseburia sp.]|nr:phosphoribosylformimino-5-aminoimidazole carboxamide ribotide isomerase [Roseburia sp.]
MEFRPCIDIHNGQVKQIVGSSLTDKDNQARENFVAAKGADYYAALYKEHGIKGGHIILLNPASSEYYEATRAQAVSALRAYPGGLQVGGGINADNVAFYLDAGASHVIVTSYVFREGRIDRTNLERICRAAGRERLVLDLSCRRRDGEYHIVTDRWQRFADEVVNARTLDMLAEYCDEFLIHAVDVEGKRQGIEQPLVERLGTWCAGREGFAVTYAGGVHSYEDIDLLKRLGGGRIHVTIGSALDIFGGPLAFTEVLSRIESASADRTKKDFRT